MHIENKEATTLGCKGKQIARLDKIFFKEYVNLRANFLRDSESVHSTTPLKGY